ncbi:TPA: hypothetical protein ROY17_001994 [Bacillus thuringiensis]|nr:hypothetical protein [Bacillus thuringiensis]
MKKIFNINPMNTIMIVLLLCQSALAIWEGKALEASILCGLSFILINFNNLQVKKEEN